MLKTKPSESSDSESDSEDDSSSSSSSESDNEDERPVKITAINNSSSSDSSSDDEEEEDSEKNNNCCVCSLPQNRNPNNKPERFIKCTTCRRKGKNIMQKESLKFQLMLIKFLSLNTKQAIQVV
jgi:DNA-directed RNA polymerase subunit M/transcription elongation factor TFIIS